ncbi:MAG: PD-(D/E)XK nuclease family protein [Verrucomicrobiota bacterium]
MPERIFLGWHQPASLLVENWLADRYDHQNGTVDYSSQLILVPVRQAIEPILALLANRHGAFLPPRILTPQLLPSLAATGSNRIPDRRTTKLFWMETMRAESALLLKAFRPEAEAPPTNRWISVMADQIISLQDELIRQGWTFTKASSVLTADGQRWSALATLEKRFEDRLTSEHWLPPSQSWTALSSDSLSSTGITSVIIASIPDLIPVAQQALATLPETTVSVLIHAPEGESTHFDEWGRPAPERWSQPIPFPNLNDQLHLLRKDEDLIDRTTELLTVHRSPAACSITTARDELRVALAARLGEENIPHINMAGESSLKLPLTSFLYHFSSVLRSPTRQHLMALIVHPWIEPSLLAATGEERLTCLLEKLDRLLENHPWRMLDDLGQISPAREELRNFARQFHSGFKSWINPFLSKSGLPALQEFLAKQSWQEGIPEEDINQVASLLEFWIHPSLQDSYSLLDCLDLCLSELNSLRLFRSAEGPTPRLHGWMDSGWASSPHLIIAGLQNGSIPQLPFSHLFLTRTSAQELGFPTGQMLHAVDAFLLQSLINSRALDGRIDILVSRSDLEGNPLLPSSLLAVAEPEIISERIEHLFTLPAPREDDASGPTVPFHLPTPPSSAERKISFTAFRRYLDSPFFYYLTDVLAWQTLDTRRNSMDPRDYGTLTHKAIELFLNEESKTYGTDPKAIEAGLLHHLENEFSRLVGNSPHLGLKIQFESIRSRLHTYALAEAELRSEGWETIAVERKFHLPIGNWTVTGKIDRIDRHPDGRVRIIDYKTSDKPDPPGKAHLKQLKSNTSCLEESIFNWNGKDHSWINLQLPLYAASQQKEFAGTKVIETGYIQLAKANEDSGLALWNDFDQELMDESLACAERVLSAIDAEKFEEPAIFNTHDRDLWHHFMGSEAFESFDFAWAKKQSGGSHA